MVSGYYAANVTALYVLFDRFREKSNARTW
jgi:hypothetical protein